MRPGPDRRLVRFAGRVSALERAQAAKVLGRAVRPYGVRDRGQRHRGDRTGHGESGELEEKKHKSGRSLSVTNLNKRDKENGKVVPAINKRASEFFFLLLANNILLNCNISKLGKDCEETREVRELRSECARFAESKV